MFDDFVNELLRIVRDGRLDSYELPYDIEGMDISYLPTRSASPGSGKAKSVSSRPKSKTKASRPSTKARGRR